MELTFLLLAFTAGMIAFFSPCCVAMLPAYVGHALRSEVGAPVAEAGPARRWSSRGLLLAGLVPLALGGWPLLRLGFASLGLGAGPSFGAGDVSEKQAALLILLGVLLMVGAGALAGGPRRLRRALAMGGTATAGFLAVFLALGLPIALVARFLVPSIPYLAIAVGLGLAAAGVFLALGRSLRWSMPLRMPALDGIRGYFVFGLAYGLASMSCTFPVFLSVIAGALFSGGIPEVLAVFAAYALGKGTLLTGITVMAATGGGSRTQDLLRRVLPRIEAASALLMVATGLYIAWYFGRALTL